PGKDASAGLLLMADPGKAVDYLQVRDGRFEGSNAAAVRVVGAAGGLEITGNRFWQAATGLRFEAGGGDPPPVNAVVRENTFFEVAVPLSFQAVPPVIRGSAVQLQRNLFGKTKQLVKFDNVRQTPEVLKAGWVWCDEGEVTEYPLGERFFRRAFDLSGSAAG